MLGSYQRSLLAILLAQFTKKRFSGGMAGVVRLASSSQPVQVHATCHVPRNLDTKPDINPELNNPFIFTPDPQPRSGDV